MKKLQKIMIFFCIIFAIASLSMKSNAYEQKEHNEYMKQVLFKNFKEVDNDDTIQNEIEALESACYLTIDQFNGNGQKILDVLIEYGVSDIPKDINEISFNASGKTHRSYTHRGWDFTYEGTMKELWSKRQDILLNTVDKVFDFDGDEAKKESFCELLYYIHILGDHKDDTSYNIENGIKIEVGGRIDKYDIIHKLLDVFEILFSEQKYTHKYISLTSTLQRLDNKLAKIIRSEGGINSNKKFELKQKYIEKIMKVLTYYLPEMLKEEKFFSEVFY